MSRQNLRSFQDIQKFKILLRSWRNIQDVERWVELFKSFQVEKDTYFIRLNTCCWLLNMLSLYVCRFVSEAAIIFMLLSRLDQS